MQPANQQQLDDFIASRLGIPLSRFLEPTVDAPPTGHSVRRNGVYLAIREARREDDATLPQGVWVHELKRADWAKVSEIAKKALSKKCKDLQLAVWLLEAEIHQHGFRAIAPCMILLQNLCEKFWEDLHPRIENGDLEFRTNPIVWADEKLLPALRLVPLTATDTAGNALTWNDWEMAQRYEAIRSKLGAKAPPSEGATVHEFATRAAATAKEFYLGLWEELDEGLASIADLNAALDRLCGDEAPRLSEMTMLLEDILAFSEAELAKRGIWFAEEGDPEPEGPGEETPPGPEGGGGGSGGGPIRSRAEAYARLNEAAEFLKRIEPHSPTPYLVKRAIEWGNMNTTELYRELFVHFQGNLNIFELLGIEEDGKSS